MSIEDFRKEYHRQICENIIRIRLIKGEEVPNFADKDSHTSVRNAQGVVARLGFPKIIVTSGKRGDVEEVETESTEMLEELIGEGISGKPGKEVREQTAGGLFERITKDFLEKSFTLLQHVRPGEWLYKINSKISSFEQYSHLAEIAEAIKGNKTLTSTLGGNYIITPDIVIARLPIPDAEINKFQEVVSRDEQTALYSPFRSENSKKPLPILHASISCKWTLRSDRSQNARTEALNLIRNRKGNLPHVVAVTAEPYLNRLASLTLGTGDLDCVYHFALRELKETIETTNIESEVDFLHMMIEGKRLRDISDLPFDLAV